LEKGWLYWLSSYDYKPKTIDVGSLSDNKTTILKDAVCMQSTFAVLQTTCSILMNNLANYTISSNVVLTASMV
jgi:hypothetical protein